jgi:hypothetical protein
LHWHLNFEGSIRTVTSGQVLWMQGAVSPTPGTFIREMKCQVPVTRLAWPLTQRVVGEAMMKIQNAGATTSAQLAANG